MDEKIIEKNLKSLLGPSRFRHSIRVRDAIIMLSRYHKVNLKKANIAGLLHDAARFMDRPQMLKAAEKIGLKIDDISRKEPKLLHAELSAYIARKEFGVRDKDILNAIKHHTLGRVKMTALEKIVYIADHTEEARNFPSVKRAREHARKNVNKAVVEIASSMINYILSKKLPIHPRTLEVRNYYLLRHD